MCKVHNFVTDIRRNKLYLENSKVFRGHLLSNVFIFLLCWNVQFPLFFVTAHYTFWLWDGECLLIHIMLPATVSELPATIFTSEAHAKTNQCESLQQLRLILHWLDKHWQLHGAFFGPGDCGLHCKDFWFLAVDCTFVEGDPSRLGHTASSTQESENHKCTC